MTEGPKETLDLTEYSQPAIFIQSYVKDIWGKENFKRGNSWNMREQRDQAK